MCLILRKPSSVEFPNDMLEEAYNNNKDGMGIMFPDDGRVIVRKVLPKDFSDVSKEWNKYKSQDLGLHFRFATHGFKDLDNCHPYQILDKDKNGADLYMMHNGVLSGFAKTRDAYSDTWHFTQTVMVPLLREFGPKLLLDPIFQAMVASNIGSGNKLLFLDSDHNWTIVNQKAGSDTEVDGCWVSNTYSFKPKYRGFTVMGSWDDKAWNSGNTAWNKSEKGAANKVYGLTDWGWDYIPTENQIFTMFHSELKNLVDDLQLEVDVKKHTDVFSLRKAVAQEIYDKKDEAEATKEEKEDTKTTDDTDDTGDIYGFRDIVAQIESVTYGDKTIEDLVHLSSQDTIRMIIQEPEAVADLLNDLLYLYCLVEQEEDLDGTTEEEEKDDKK